MFEFEQSMISRLGQPITPTTYLLIENFLNPFMSRYEYEGLDDNFKKLYGNRNLLDLFLFFSYGIAWFDDPVNGLMCLPLTGEYKYNAVGKPTEWLVYALNGSFTRTLNEDNSVLMFNDESRTIPYMHLLYEASFMEKCDAACRQNLELQSTPYIIEAYDENIKSANKWANLLSTFASRIVLRKKRDDKGRGLTNDLERSQVLNTSVELKTKDYMQAFNSFLFRAFTYLGIKNINVEKAERLVVGETSQNDMIIQMNYTNSLQARQKAFDEIKQKFGYTITVKPTELETLYAQMSTQHPQSNPNFGGNDYASSNPTIK